MHIGRTHAGFSEYRFQTTGSKQHLHYSGKNLGAKLEYHALNIHIPWYAAAYNFLCISAMSDPTLFVGDYNISPQQCLTTHFSCETTISGPDNVGPHTFRARLPYQALTMPDPTLCVRDYNIRPGQCQTPRFSFVTTISGPDNVRPHAFRARLQYQALTMSDPSLFVRDNNIRPTQCQAPTMS